jgi:hypothetical protein
MCKVASHRIRNTVEVTVGPNRRTAAKRSEIVEGSTEQKKPERCRENLPADTVKVLAGASDKKRRGQSDR